MTRVELVRQNHHLFYGRLNESGYDVYAYLMHYWSEFEDFIKRYKIIHLDYKIDIVIVIRMKRFDDNEWKYFTIFRHSGYKVNKMEIINTLVNHIEEFIENGSGWIIDQIIQSEIYLCNYDPLIRRQCIGRGDIKLPKEIENKKAVLNINNTNGECFLYSLLAFLKNHQISSKSSRGDASSYNVYRSLFNMEGIDIPFNLKHFNRFHNQNQSYAINIFEYIGDGNVKILRRPYSHFYHDRKIINILYLENNGNGHFCPIINLNRLLNSKKLNSKYCRQRFWCCKCLLSFYTKHKLDLHQVHCFSSNEKSFSVPENLEFKFTNYQKLIDPSHLIFADFECMIDDENKHIPIACAYMRYSSFEKEHYESYCDIDCVEWFFRQMRIEMEYVQNWISIHSKIMKKLSPEQEIQYDLAENCYCCGNNIIKNKVRDHCHYTGEYRGAACISCNSKLKMHYKSLKVFFHNLKNYDSHLLCKYGLINEKDTSIHVVAQSSEKYISFTINFYNETKFQLQFIDSCQHLNASLATLFDNLPYNERSLTLKIKDENISDEVLMKKGVFPYEYLNSIEKLDDVDLPDKISFYSKLTDTYISDSDYERAKVAWKQFRCKTLKDYMMSYLKMDVHQLADIFINYIKLCKSYYNLNPCNYLTLPSLTLDASLLYSNLNLELLNDEKMIYDFLHGIKGGMVFVNYHRFIKDDVNTHLTLVDANNLYGYAMTMNLPKNNFHYLKNPESFDFNIDPFDNIGYYFVVDLFYPPEIHDITHEFPLAPEQMLIDNDLLSDFMNQSTQREKPSKKLLLNQFDKIEYHVFYPLLKFYISMGMKIKKIHRIIAFEQESFLKDYITFNSKMRQQAKSAFEKDFFKLLNNSLYGKLIENIGKRVDFRLCTNSKELEKTLANPALQTSYFFDNNLTGHTIGKYNFEMNRPIAVGCCILDLSKLIMYELYYNKIRKLLPNVNIYASDTDSFFLKTTNLSKDQVITKLMPILDSSNFPINSEYYSINNKAKLGFIKDEGAGNIILDAIFLKPKMYSLLYDSDKYNKKTAKGISRNSIKKLSHTHYIDAYDCGEMINVDVSRIGSKDHNLYTFHQKKKTLSSYDNKRCWLDGNQSLPYGHYKLNQIRPIEKIVKLKCIPE